MVKKTDVIIESITPSSPGFCFPSAPIPISVYNPAKRGVFFAEFIITKRLEGDGPDAVLAMLLPPWELKLDWVNSLFVGQNGIFKLPNGDSYAFLGSEFNTRMIFGASRLTSEFDIIKVEQESPPRRWFSARTR